MCTGRCVLKMSSPLVLVYSQTKFPEKSKKQVFAQKGPFWEGARLLGHGYLTVIIMNAGFLDGKPSQNVRIHRSRPSSPSTGRNSAHARDGEMFMDSEKCAHLSMPVASRARPESELGCHGGAGSWDCHLSPT